MGKHSGRGVCFTSHLYQITFLIMEYYLGSKMVSNYFCVNSSVTVVAESIVISRANKKAVAYGRSGSVLVH